jgi:hypothetical protein
MDRPQLKAVHALTEYRLAVTFLDGSQSVLDLKADVLTLPGLHPLQNSDLFSQARVGDSGWTAEWETPDIQIGADTLYAISQA